METLNLKIVSGSDNNGLMAERIESFAKRPIGEIVSEDYRKAEVFKKYQLDFCCGGKKTVEQACDEKNIDLSALQFDLYEMDQRNFASGHSYNQWSPDFLIDYIVNTHHAYVREAIPVLMEYTRKVAKVHGENHPEVILIAENFYEAAQELIEHMAKEENILFPYIKQLWTAVKQSSEAAQPIFGSVQNPINMMEHEHETVGTIFKSIRALSNNFTPPEGACMTYKVSFLKLNEFEEDLHRHIHLENNILFPKSIQLEKEYYTHSPYNV